MIKQELFKINGISFTRTYSDENRYVIRDDIEYTEACDPTEFARTYSEGRIIEINNEEIPTALNILLGEEN